MISQGYIFVGGLHRSGTSPLTRMIEALPGVAGVGDAPVPEREGVYLQGAIPHTAQHGCPMHFGTDPDQHHVEGSRYDSLAVRERLEADWSPWFERGARWRVEKSPVNLTRTRLYQQLFPLAHFVLIVRHPQAVHGAVSKWVDMGRDDAVEHWLETHRIVAEDVGHLHHALVLRYEDLVAEPDRHRRAIAAFLRLDAPGPGVAEEAPALADRNGGYEGWTLPDAQAEALSAWGYGSDMAVAPFRPVIRHALNETRTEVARILGVGD